MSGAVFARTLYRGRVLEYGIRGLGRCCISDRAGRLLAVLYGKSGKPHDWIYAVIFPNGGSYPTWIVRRGYGRLCGLGVYPFQHIQPLLFEEIQDVDKDPVFRQLVTVTAVYIDDTHFSAIARS